MASVNCGFCPPSPCDFAWRVRRSPSNGNFVHNHDTIDNREYMDTILVMLENQQSLRPSCNPKTAQRISFDLQIMHAEYVCKLYERFAFLRLPLLTLVAVVGIMAHERPTQILTMPSCSSAYVLKLTVETKL